MVGWMHVFQLFCTDMPFVLQMCFQLPQKQNAQLGSSQYIWESEPSISKMLVLSLMVFAEILMIHRGGQLHMDSVISLRGSMIKKKVHKD